MQQKLADEVIKLVESGQLVLMGEFRGSKLETINYKSKKDGSAQSFSFWTCGIEPKGKPAIIVRLDLAEGDTVAGDKVLADGKEKVLPFVKGDAVLFVVDEVTTVRGVVQMRSKDMRKVAA